VSELEKTRGVGTSNGTTSSGNVVFGVGAFSCSAAVKLRTCPESDAPSTVYVAVTEEFGSNFVSKFYNWTGLDWTEVSKEIASSTWTGI
jgi:hypothetical protein